MSNSNDAEGQSKLICGKTLFDDQNYYLITNPFFRDCGMDTSVLSYFQPEKDGADTAERVRERRHIDHDK